MKKIELTKTIKLEVPENIKSIIDGDKLEQCFESVIRLYYKHSQFADGELITRIKNSLLALPDIYLWKDD